jgi:hypothetical protein
MSPEPAQRPECCREFIEDLSTQATKEVVITETGIGTPNYWYMVYTDDVGTTHTVKGTIKGIRRSFRDGLLGDAENIRVAQVKEGPYEPLKYYAEFRDLVVHPVNAQTPLPATKDAIPAPKQQTKTPVDELAVPGADNSSVLEHTTIGLPGIKATAHGPVINFNAHTSSLGVDVWRWVLAAFIFLAAGIGISYFYLPISRYIRYWLGLMD